jgi:hypothetical protein
MEACSDACLREEKEVTGQATGLVINRPGLKKKKLFYSAVGAEPQGR